jgi:hypothetical protein
MASGASCARSMAILLKITRRNYVIIARRMVILFLNSSVGPKKDIAFKLL